MVDLLVKSLELNSLVKREVDGDFVYFNRGYLESELSTIDNWNPEKDFLILSQINGPAWCYSNINEEYSFDSLLPNTRNNFDNSNNNLEESIMKSSPIPETNNNSSSNTSSEQISKINEKKKKALKLKQKRREKLIARTKKMKKTEPVSRKKYDKVKDQLISIKQSYRDMVTSQFKYGLKNGRNVKTSFVLPRALYDSLLGNCHPHKGKKRITHLIQNENEMKNLYLLKNIKTNSSKVEKLGFKNVNRERFLLFPIKIVYNDDSEKISFSCQIRVYNDGILQT